MVMMRKIVVIITIMLVAIQCTNKTKLSNESTVEINQQLIDSARMKIDKAKMLFVNAQGNVDSLNKVDDLFDEAIAINPKDITAYVMKIQFLSAIDKTKEAQDFNDLTLKRFPNDQELYFMQGVFYEKEELLDLAQKSYNQSLLYYDKAIKEEPYNFDLLLNRLLVKMFAEDKDTFVLEDKIEELQKIYDEESDEYKRLSSLQELASETNRAAMIKAF